MADGRRWAILAFSVRKVLRSEGIFPITYSDLQTHSAIPTPSTGRHRWTRAHILERTGKGFKWWKPDPANSITDNRPQPYIAKSRGKEGKSWGNAYKISNISALKKKGMMISGVSSDTLKGAWCLELATKHH